MNYYNEFDPFAAAWLRELIKEKLIPQGDVDERSITEIQPDDLRGYTQCHFFAGIGGWSLALQLAGWPSDRPVWTGSCPCQPFSSAGRQEQVRWDTEDCVWIDCPDGKQRLVEREFCCLVNGLYVRVADVRRAYQHETEKGIIFYGSTNKKHRTEIMRELRNTYAEKAFWEAVAGFIGVQEAAVLQPFLFDFLSAQERFTNNSGIKEACAENDEGQLRSVPHNEIVDSASCGWKPAEQSNRESANTLRELSFFLARCAYSCRAKTNQAHARTFPLLRKEEINRVGKLRGYGNAIVPKVATEFIKAFLEVEND